MSDWISRGEFFWEDVLDALESPCGVDACDQAATVLEYDGTGRARIVCAGHSAVGRERDRLRTALQRVTEETCDRVARDIALTALRADDAPVADDELIDSSEYQGVGYEIYGSSRGYWFATTINGHRSAQMRCYPTVELVQGMILAWIKAHQ
jgi:hypothetical protein